MSAQVAADLRAAAEVLRRDGWCQAVHENSLGCRCVTGATAFAISGTTSRPGLLELSTNDEFDRWVAAMKLLRLTVGNDSAVSWNDTPGRTADEVIAALEAAADAAEAQP